MFVYIRQRLSLSIYVYIYTQTCAHSKYVWLKKGAHGNPSHLGCFCLFEEPVCFDN